jgi:hypothetical protein
VKREKSLHFRTHISGHPSRPSRSLLRGQAMRRTLGQA